MKDEKASKKSKDMGPNPKQYQFLLLAALLVMIVHGLWNTSQPIENLPYSRFIEFVNQGKISSVSISENRISGEFKEPQEKGRTQFTTIPLNDPSLVPLLREKAVTFRAEPNSPFWTNILSWLLPFLIFYWVAGFFLKGRMGQTPGGIFGMTHAKAKVFVEKDIKTTFADVAGVDEAKEELKEIVQFLEDPKKYSRLGGRAPKGILLVGPPGTGKTLIARAVAGEAKVPFLSINGSEFVELFVGLGAARVRDLFEQARKVAPSILFIDEIDALGKARGAGLISGANDEKEQTLNQLLAEMDGFDPSGGVIILAATNRPEILDPALLRAGRFDRQVLLNTPDQVGRTQVLKVHIKRITLDPNVKPEKIAALTPGFSGADLANLVNEAALIATRRSASTVTENDFTRAIERIVAGLEQKSKLMNPEEKKRIAYHEMGHATAALALRGTEKVHKVSIIPRGMGALGYTLQRPTEDRYLMDRNEMVRKIAVLLGGRASETLFFPAVSTGAADDLVKATDISRAMVTQYGMSETIGLATFEERMSPMLQSPFQLKERRPFSEETAKAIDKEVKSVLDESFRTALEHLTTNRSFIEAGARRLLEIETIDEDELLKLWGQFGKPPLAEPTTVVSMRTTKRD